MESETKIRVGKGENGKRIALAVLAVVSAWLVYRNLLAPSANTVASAPAATMAATRAADSRSSSPSRGRDRTMDQKELSSLDPTLRLDLLETSQQAHYTGTFRNIFLFYTPPPPKPVAPPVVQTPPQPPTPPVAPAVTIPLKFYGIASRAGSPEKKAFLTEGDDIYIGQEGDTIDKNYKITRIGVTSIEIEDIRTKQKHQLQLIQE